MISARRISFVLAQKMVDVYNGVLKAIQPASLPWRYQPLGQDASSTDTNAKANSGRNRLPVRLWKLLAYIIAFLCVLAAIVQISRGRGIFSTASRQNVSKEQFLAAILGEPVEGLLDPEPIRKKCSETKFQEGLVWHCAAVVGGIGNVGNMWLNCVRYAIEAGGMVFIFLFLICLSSNAV